MRTILKEYEIDTDGFSDEMYAEMNQRESELETHPLTCVPLAISLEGTDESILSRLPSFRNERYDLTSLCVFSIDPPGCKDVDDAVSIDCFPEQNRAVVGIHIADVSYFVKPGSKLDRYAAQRGTTVYLADTRYNMLPDAIAENFCSLHQGTPKSAMSVLVEFDLSSMQAIKTWFGRSKIVNRYELCYEEAQHLVDEDLSSAAADSLVTVNELKQKIVLDKKTREELQQKLRILIKITDVLRVLLFIYLLIYFILFYSMFALESFLYILSIINTHTPRLLSLLFLQIQIYKIRLNAKNKAQ